MRFFLVFFFLFAFTQQTFAQQTEEWKFNLENPKYSSERLHPENKLEQYRAYNFSTLMVPRNEFLGFIGSKYRRIKIFYTSITKDVSDPETYHVKGISLVKTNKCNFEGTITLRQVREFENMHYGVDEMYKDRGIQAQGIVLADYEFKEDPAQNHVGIFKGLMTLWWYTDSQNILHYDAIQKHSDRYKNNQYVGTWTGYGKEKAKVCNWGERRIPFAGELDMGAGEFSPDPKYYPMGWKDFAIY